MELTATDLAIQVSTKLPVDLGGGDFYAAVPARKLLDVLRVLEDYQVFIEEGPGKLQIRGATSRFAVQTMPGTDFPLVSESIQFGGTLCIAQDILRTLLGQVSFAMARADDPRIYLHRVHLRAEGRMLQLSAADGHRLALAHAEIPTELQRQDVLLPRRTVKLILGQLRRIKGSEEEVQLRFSAAQAELTTDGTRVLSSLLSGRFPELQGHVPTTHPVSLVLERHLLAGCLRLSAVLSADPNVPALLALEAGLLSMSSLSHCHDEPAAEMPVEYSGGRVQVGINPRYLLEALLSMTQDHVRIRLEDEASSLLMQALGDSSFTYVLVPMRI